MRTLPFVIAIIFMISSCKKTDPQKDEIKYEIISTVSAPMAIEYVNQFGTWNSEDFVGNSWSKTIDASQYDTFQFTCTQNLQGVLGTQNIIVRIYYRGEMVAEQINDVTNTIDIYSDLYGYVYFTI